MPALLQVVEEDGEEEDQDEEEEGDVEEGDLNKKSKWVALFSPARQPRCGAPHACRSLRAVQGYHCGPAHASCCVHAQGAAC